MFVIPLCVFAKPIAEGNQFDPHCHIVGCSGIIVVVAAFISTSPVEKRVGSRGVAPSRKYRRKSVADNLLESLALIV